MILLKIIIMERTMDSLGNPILEVKNLVKKFPEVIALKGIDFDLRKREIHAIVGQNGAGKSTFVKVLNGIYKPDEGTIIIDGKKVYIKSASDAKKYGLTLIHQEVMVIPNLTIAENIHISKLKFAKRVNINELADNAKKYLEIVGLSVDPKTKVKELRVVEQQLVQFARALAEDAKIICVDELTSALNPIETKHILDVMQELKKNEKSFIFITHRVEEVFQVADRVTVLRDGMKVLTKDIPQTSISEIVSAMVGRRIEEIYIYRQKKLKSEVSEKPVLRVSNLSTSPSRPTETPLKNISFDLYKGEILGIVGLLGAGKTELGKALIGLQKIVSGKIILENKEIHVKSPVDALRYGIFYLPEDRRREGVITSLHISDNIVIPPATLMKISIVRLIRRLGIEHEIARKWVKDLNIVTPSIKFKVEYLSGGNKQKVVIAKALETQAKILIFDEPTFGIDIGAKAEIRKIINDLAEAGLSIILLTSDIDEALSLSDRIMVLSNGRAVATLLNKDLKRDDVINLLR